MHGGVGTETVSLLWPLALCELKSCTDNVEIKFSARLAFVNITPQVEEAVRKGGVRDGIALVNSMHLTVQPW